MPIKDIGQIRGLRTWISYISIILSITLSLCKTKGGILLITLRIQINMLKRKPGHLPIFLQKGWDFNDTDDSELL